MTTMNRRDFLGASAVLAGLGLAGCAGGNAPAEEPEAEATEQEATEPEATAEPEPEAATPLSHDEAVARMNEIISDPEHPLAAACLGVIKDHEIYFAEGVGTAHFGTGESSMGDVPCDADTKYRIASISKLSTATAAWQLVEQGLLDPDADASDYLGFELRNPSFPDTPITLKMLMSHTSSIREGGDNSGKYNIPYPHPISEFFTPGAECYCEGCWAPAEEAPGEFFSYCNMNYCLVATIVEKLSGERFDQYVVNHIYGPMGLTCSFNVYDMDEDARAHVGTLYRKLDENGEYDLENGTWTAQCDDWPVGDPAPDYSDYEIGSNGSLFGPMGSLRVSVTELCKLMQMWSNGGEFNGAQILKPETIERMFTPVWNYDEATENGDTYWGLMLSYCMGPQVFTNTDGGDRLLPNQDVPFAGHTAEAYGLLGGLAFDRELGNGIVYIVAGTGIDMDTYYGEYSAFYGWEESLLTLGGEVGAFEY